MHSCNLTVFYWAGTRAPQQNAVVAGSSGLVQSSSYSTCFIGPPPSCVQNGCSNTVQIAGLSLRNGQAMLDQEVTACATGLRALQLSLACLPWCCPSQDRVPLLQCRAHCRAHCQLTAQGGHDLGGPPFASVSVQTNMDSQSTGRLWPRLNPRGTKTKIAFVALTQLRPCTNFLVLHYLATDSAQGWENFLSQCIPNGNWMPTTSRRAMLI